MLSVAAPPKGCEHKKEPSVHSLNLEVGKMKKLFFLLGIVVWSVILLYTAHATSEDQTGQEKAYKDPQAQADSFRQKIKTPDTLKPGEKKGDADSEKSQEFPDEPEDCDC